MEDVMKFLLNDLNLKYGDSVVVACSGGPDSMALLHLLKRLKDRLDIEVVCAHVNHNVRKESAEEKIFVEKFCLVNNLKFEYMVIENYGDDNFHNEARTIRYNYFEQIVKKYNAKYLFTAHHGDDLVETILMRLVRGSTLRGYSGFSKIVKMKDYTIVRPLIEVTKEDLENYDKEHGIDYVFDSSNAKDKYTRNRYRKYILPELKKEDPNVHKKFYKFSTILLQYNDYIDKQVNKIFPDVFKQNTLDIKKFKSLDYLIQQKIIYSILESIYQDDLMLITDHHADLLLNLIETRKANSLIYLPNNIKALKEYDNLTFITEIPEAGSYEIDIINYLNLPNGKNIEVVSSSDDTSNNVCRLYSKDVKLPLRVRTRMDGDKISVKGMLGRKKVNDIFIDEKIPASLRNTWPIVVDSENNVVWIPGLKKSKFDRPIEEKCDIILKYY